MKQTRKWSNPIRVPTTEYPSFADRLTIVMFLRKISVEELAKDVFVSKGAICNYRSGLRSPDLNTLRRLSIALKVSTDFLLGLDEYLYE